MIKSPTIEENARINPITMIFTIEPSKTSGQIKYERIPPQIEPKNPPAKPTILLFGLAFINPRLFFPKRTPKNQASESQKNTINKKQAISGVV